MGAVTSLSGNGTDATPFRDVYENYLVDYVPEFGNPLVWNQELISFMFGKTIVFVILSITCIILNIALLCFLFSDKQYRNLYFAPLVIQAITDAVGPGFANAFYEVGVYRKYKREALRQIAFKDYKDYTLFDNSEFFEVLRIDGVFGCVLTYAR